MLMCIHMLNRRVQILFDKDLWNKLIKTCKAQNISAGEFIRVSVRAELEKNKVINDRDKITPFNRLFKSRSKAS